MYNTPIPNKPFTSIIGHNGITEAVEEILKGEYVFLPVIYPTIVEFFYHVKITDKIMREKIINSDTKIKKNILFWQQGHTKISSLMSGMHNGHYIAAKTSTLLSTIYT